jgi:hypothetical protein
MYCWAGVPLGGGGKIGGFIVSQASFPIVGKIGNFVLWIFRTPRTAARRHHR